MLVNHWRGCFTAGQFILFIILSRHHFKVITSPPYEWQDHSVVLNKYVSHSLFHTLQTIKTNYGKRLGQVVFKNHNCNPFQSSPSLPNFTYIKLAGADGPSIHPSLFSRLCYSYFLLRSWTIILVWLSLMAVSTNWSLIHFLTLLP